MRTWLVMDFSSVMFGCSESTKASAFLISRVQCPRNAALICFLSAIMVLGSKDHVVNYIYEEGDVFGIYDVLLKVPDLTFRLSTRAHASSI